jgi:RNA polymerase sigma-70 factor (ECF subfamily)
MSLSTSRHIERCLKRLLCDDRTVRNELLEYSQRRLKTLAVRMFAQFPMLQRREEVDDILQEALLRLWTSVEEVRPETVMAFMGLAALQIRRSLLDLARRHFGRKNGHKTGQVQSLVPTSASNWRLSNRFDDLENAPEVLMSWTEFHEAADSLPEPERSVFDLLYYHELPQVEVMELLNMSDRKVRSLWQSAQRKIARKIGGSWPAI